MDDLCSAVLALKGDGTLWAWGWNDYGQLGDGTMTTRTTPVHASGLSAITALAAGYKHSLAAKTAAGSVLAADSFSRSVTNGWGSAESGGAYEHQGVASTYSVSSGAGRMLLPAGGGGVAWLPSAQALNVDLQVRMSSDKLAAGGPQVATLLLRRMADGSEYRAHLQFETNGSLRLRVSRFISGSETTIGGLVTVPGLTHTANRFVWLRAQVSGTTPTTLRVKVWEEGSLEPPAWLLHAKDSSASLQGSGTVGLPSSLGAATTNAPVRLAFDDLLVVPTGTTLAADRFARTITGGWAAAMPWRGRLRATEWQAGWAR